MSASDAATAAPDPAATPDPAGAPDATAALVERLFAASLGAMDLLCVHIGDALGLYRALDERGPSTPAGLAAAAGIAERYAREWLEQQAMSGILAVEDADAPDAERRYLLPPAHRAPLIDETSLDYMAPVAQLTVACAQPLDRVVDAFRTGEGVPYAAYGRHLHEGQGRFTRVMFDNLLAQEWLPAVPEVHARLSSGPPARVLDVACGVGRSTLAIARAYPAVEAVGLDSDAASIDAAERIRADADPAVAGRVSFRHGDAAEADDAGRFQLATIFEALHDMSDPVGVLSAVRRLLAPDGVLMVADERVADRFRLDAGEVERWYYGFSVTHCLPVGMVGEDPAGTGTVMREATVRDYAARAGFAAVEVLPIDSDFYRFYLMRP